MSSFQKDSKTWQNSGVTIWKCQLSVKSMLGMSGAEDDRLSLKPLAYTDCLLEYS